MHSFLTVALLCSLGSHGARGEPAGPTRVYPSQRLSLGDCVAFALANHPGAKVSLSNVTSAQARVAQATASRYPTVGLSSNWSRFDSSSQGFAVGSAGATESRQTSIGLSYLFLDSGERATAIRQATATAGAAEAGVGTTEQDLALGVAEAYYDLLAAQKLKGMREKVVASAEQHVASAEAGVGAGTSARIDVLRAQTELANARVEVIAADGAIQRARASLRNAMGIAENVPIEVREEESLPNPSLSLPEAQAEAAASRPELRQQSLNVSAGRESLRSAEIDAGLAFSVTGGYDRYLDSSREVTSEYVLRAGVSYPLFDGKASRSRVEAAKADLTADQQQLERQRQTVLLEVERAWIAVAESKARISAADTARAQAEENLALNEAAYGEGVATMVEVIDARASAAQAETNQIEARYDHDLAVLALRHAMGRGLIEEETQ